VAGEGTGGASPMAQTDSSALLGRVVAGKFVIEAVIGVGGTGTVYRARQLALDRTVALKVLHRDIADDELFAERFKREARAASRLDHPNSVRVLDFGRDSDGLLYLAMEHVQGRTLHQVIREDGPLGDERIVDILAQVLAALSVAHEMGVIHRDLKPENIIILRGRSDEGDSAELAKVCDFGIATIVAAARDGTDDGARMTLRGYVVGTPEYMSPEQVRGEAADQRSDLYSVGVVLYQMLTGQPPFTGDSPFGLAVKHATEAPAPPSTLRAVNPGLEAICLRAMSKAPADRFPVAREMRAALRAALTPSVLTPPPATEAPTAVERRPQPAQGRPSPGAPTVMVARRRSPLGLLAVAVAVAAVAAFFLWPESPAAPPREHSPATGPQAAAAGPSPPIMTQDGFDLKTPSPPVLVAHSERWPVKSGGAAKATGATASTAAAGLVDPSAGRAIHGHPPSVRRPARADSAVEGRPAVPSAVSGPAGAGPPAVGGPLASAAAAPPDPAGASAADPSPGRSSTPSPLSPPPRPATVDLDSAGVSVGAVSTASGIPGSNVRAAVNRLPLARCYRDALRGRGAPAPGTANLLLKMDASGYVTSAVLEGADFLPAMRGCIEQAARSLRVRDVDTGEASATVTLSFVSRP
jgi:serine/threonine protein kinase